MEIDELKTVLGRLCSDGLARSNLALKIGVSPATMSRWLNGRVTIPASDAKLLRLIAYMKNRRIGWEKIGSRVMKGAEDLL